MTLFCMVSMLLRPWVTRVPLLLTEGSRFIKPPALPQLLGVVGTSPRVADTDVSGKRNNM